MIELNKHKLETFKEMIVAQDKLSLNPNTQKVNEYQSSSKLFYNLN